WRADRTTGAVSWAFDLDAPIGRFHPMRDGTIALVDGGRGADNRPLMRVHMLAAEGDRILWERELRETEGYLAQPAASPITLAHSNGDLILATSVGSEVWWIAAIDGDSGEPRWQRTYEFVTDDQDQVPLMISERDDGEIEIAG